MDKTNTYFNGWNEKLNGQDFFSQVEKQFGNKVLGPFVKLSRSTRIKGSNFLSFSSEKKKLSPTSVFLFYNNSHTTTPNP